VKSDDSQRLRRRNEERSNNNNVDEEPERRVFVQYKAGLRSDFESRIQQRFSRTRMHYDFPDMDTLVLTVKENDLADLRRDPSVESVHNDVPRYPFYIPESVKRRELQDGGNQQIPYGIDMVQAQQAWAAGATGANIKVCVVDTGVAEHPDLLDVTGPDLPLPFSADGVGHGTHCAGTIAAADNSFGVVGVAPNAEIISVKVFSDDGLYAYSSGILSAAQECQSLGADIISMSLGGPLPNIFELLGYRNLERDGIITVAAAGNFGNSLWSFPASYPGVVSVAAVDENKVKASFSQTNRQVDIAAPGVDVLSTLPQDGACDICDSIGEYSYGTISGTSMACPHVAGVLALLKSKYNATASEYIAAIENTAEDLGRVGRDNNYGHGLVQAYEALQYLENISSRSDVNINQSNDPATEAPTNPPTNPPTNSPTNPPTNSPTNPPTNPPTILLTDPENEAISCNENEFLFELKLLTDNRASEISWTLDVQSDVGTNLNGGGYNNDEALSVKKCIAKSCYIFTMSDSGDDGICCSHGNGAYSIFIDNEVLVNGGGDFGSEDIITLGCNNEWINSSN